MDHYLRALCLARQLGDRYSELQLLSQAGDAQHDAGDMTAARDHWHQALAIIEELQLPHTEELRDKLRVSLRPKM